MSNKLTNVQGKVYDKQELEKADLDFLLVSVMESLRKGFAEGHWVVQHGRIAKAGVTQTRRNPTFKN